MQPMIAVPATLLLMIRAWRRNSLTPAGIAVGGVTALIHALHPWSVFFACLVVFFLAGSSVTKVRHDVKARLTVSASGAPGGEGPRTHQQVLATSGVASVLVLLHLVYLKSRAGDGGIEKSCWAWDEDILVPGIIANYAAVAADTFASELGILSKSRPRLITSRTLREVPPGTNGGVTLFGTLAGLLGSFLVALTSALFLPFCRNTRHGSVGSKELALWVAFMTVWGGLGSLLDSFLGGWLQATVVDVRSGKVVEGPGGRKVLVSTGFNTTPEPKADAAGTLHQTSDKRSDDPDIPNHSTAAASRKLESGVAILDNNAVNFLMALMMSVGAILAANWLWSPQLRTVRG